MHAEMEEFLELLRGMDRSEGTVKQYRLGLENFSEWIDAEQLEIRSVGPRDVQRFLAYMKNDRGFAPKTIRVRFTGVSQFYKDITNNGIDFDNPTGPIEIGDYAPDETKRAQVTKQEHIWMEKEQVKQIVENAPAPKLRNRLIILFQYFTALRRQEVVDVKLEDIDREHRKVKVRGKHDNHLTARWQPRIDGLMNAWIDGGYRDSYSQAEESSYLFLSRAAPKLGADRVNDIVVEAADRAGIQKILYQDVNGNNRYKYTSHTLRHSFAMHHLQNGGSFEGLSHLLGHSDLETTQIYAEMLEDRADAEYEQYAPDIEMTFEW